MKQLILANGTMGAGKSAVSNQLLRLLAPSVLPGWGLVLEYEPLWQMGK